MPSIYVHVPFCIQKCDYCAFYSHSLVHSPQDLISSYLEGLEIEMGKRKKDAHQGVSSLFIGGGTPTSLKDRDLEHLMEMINRHFRLNPEAENTVEGNPGTITTSKLTCLRSYGINRFSLGVQAFNDKLLKAVGRMHTAEDAREAIGRLRTAGFDNLNLDLMFGLPTQDMAMWQASLEEALSFWPEHLSLYGLMLEEGTPLYERYSELVQLKLNIETSVGESTPTEAEYGVPLPLVEVGVSRLDEGSDDRKDRIDRSNKTDRIERVKVKAKSQCSSAGKVQGDWLPDDDLQAEMHDWAVNRLKQAGYMHYETSNFAHRGYECQHNLGYWRGKDYLGLGPGGVSCLNGVRWKNIEEVRIYQSRLSIGQDPVDEAGQEVLSLHERMAERMILGLRLEEGVNLTSFRNDFGVDLRDIYKDVLERYKHVDIFMFQGEYIRLNEKYSFVANSILQDFV